MKVKKHKKVNEYADFSLQDTASQLVSMQIKFIMEGLEYRIKQAFKNKGFNVDLWSSDEIISRVSAKGFDGLVTLSCDDIPVCTYGTLNASDFKVIEENGKFRTDYILKFEEH